MEIIQLIIGLASIVSVVAVIWALRKVMQIYGITVDSSELDKWEYGSDPITGNDDFTLLTLLDGFHQTGQRGLGLQHIDGLHGMLQKQ